MRGKSRVWEGKISFPLVRPYLYKQLAEYLAKDLKERMIKNDKETRKIGRKRKRVSHRSSDERVSNKESYSFRKEMRQKRSWAQLSTMMIKKNVEKVQN